MTMSIGKQIKKYLKENGIKQKFISKKTGLSERCISDILNDKRKPKFEYIQLICQALKVDINFFCN